MRRIILPVCLFLFSSMPVWALEDRSETTRIEMCESRDPGDFAHILAECESYAGYRVMLAASEHSARLSFGRNGMLAQFDEAPRIGGLYVALGPVIEWRHRAGEDFPYDNIVRWRCFLPQRDEETGEMTNEEEIIDNVLVVSRLDNDSAMSACHIAYIDATEVYGANEVAHRLARRYAPEFRCGVDPVMRINARSAEQLGLTGN